MLHATYPASCVCAIQWAGRSLIEDSDATARPNVRAYTRAIWVCKNPFCHWLAVTAAEGVNSKSGGRHVREVGQGQESVRIGGSQALTVLPPAKFITKFSLNVHNGTLRSEERRVGKECVITCRSRCSRYH